VLAAEIIAGDRERYPGLMQVWAERVLDRGRAHLDTARWSPNASEAVSKAILCFALLRRFLLSSHSKINRAFAIVITPV
jgi:hypothetical protein